jgi:hypothetical protein
MGMVWKGACANAGGALLLLKAIFPHAFGTET